MIMNNLDPAVAQVSFKHSLDQHVDQSCWISVEDICSLNVMRPVLFSWPFKFPQELVTYGGNGQVFSNWAQVRLDSALIQNGVCNHVESLNRWSVRPCAVPPGDALPEWDDRGTNSGHVQWSSHGSVPQPAIITTRHHHQRHGKCTVLYEVAPSVFLCAEILLFASLRSFPTTHPRHSMKRCLRSVCQCKSVCHSHIHSRFFDLP